METTINKSNSNNVTRRIRVLIADDDQLVREITPKLLYDFEDIDVIATAENGSEVVKILDKYTVDIILMDVDMPKLNGIEATRWISKQYPNVKVLVYTAFEQRSSVMEAIQAGAVGYITKDMSPVEIATSLRRTESGESVISREPAEAMFKMVRAQELETKVDPEFRKAVDSLTNQQRKVYGMLVEGLSNHNIAKKMKLQEITIRGHVSQILEKTGCESRSQVVVKAFENHLIS